MDNRFFLEEEIFLLEKRLSEVEYEIYKVEKEWLETQPNLIIELYLDLRVLCSERDVLIQKLKELRYIEYIFSR